MALAAGGAFAFLGGDSDAEKERAALAAHIPKQLEIPDTVGFEFDILCDGDAAALFTFEEGDVGVLARRVMLRNGHLEAETGATVQTAVSEDFYNAAKNDILSGTYKYDLYAATAQRLSRLLAEGDLSDVSDSPYIDVSDAHFDKNTTDSLAIGGGRYLISSAAADARLYSAAIALTGDFEEWSDLRESALDGGFTFERMHQSGGMLLDDGAVYPLWFGSGNSFVSYGGEEPQFISHGDFCESIEKLRDLTNEGEDKSDVFELVTAYDASQNPNAVILPLPKASEEDSYGGYINLERAVVTAIPRSKTADISEYMLDRMAYLSLAYTEPYFTEAFGENADVYEIIKMSSSADLSVLFGYGDIGGLVGEALRDGTQLSLDYYNRKALYEKALSIIAKRLCIEE